MTYGELYEGAYYDRDPHRALSDLASLLFDIEIADLSVPIMKRFGILRGQLSRHLRRQIGDMDFLIAATALEYDMTLVTRNIRDFQHIPALKVFEFDVAD